MFAYAVSLLTPTLFNLEDVARLKVGPISGRLMGQFLFGEAILFSIVLGTFHRAAERSGRGLVLGGHTHGGQVVLPFFGPPKTASRLPRLYAGGLHDYRGIPLHVSRGVGMERGFDVPVRFLCPPEICVLDVRWPRLPLRVGRLPRIEKAEPGGDGDGRGTGVDS